MKRIAVYCGSKTGVGLVYAEAARETGRTLAQNGIELVYGGASVGTMKILADAALEAGGRVIGVIPRSMMAREIAHDGLSELHVVETMHGRKALMSELADGFIALPGGLGTLDEFFEALTWAQIGLHRKPCGVLNIAGFYDSLLAFLDHAALQGLIRPQHREMVLADTDPQRLIDKFGEYQVPVVSKWED